MGNVYVFYIASICIHGEELPFHRKYKQLFFYSRAVNFLMQLQFLAPVELFFKQLNGFSF